MAATARDYYTPEQMKELWNPQWLETHFQNSLWYAAKEPITDEINPVFDQYHPYVCHVCKRGPFTNGIKTLRCGKCKIIRYCCAEHQRKDWKNHKSYCRAYTKMRASRAFSELPVAQDLTSWRKHTMALTRLLDQQLELPFHSTERQIAALQPRCRNCYVAGTEATLIPCPTCCGVALCKACHDDPSRFHSSTSECDSYVLALACTGMVIEQGNPLQIPSITDCSEGGWVPNDWHEYLARKRHDFGILINHILHMAPVMAFVTDGLSIPLTLHKVLHHEQLLHNDMTSKLVVHVAGAGLSDGVMERYLELARLNPQLTDLIIVLIGPDMPDSPPRAFATDPESPLRSSCQAHWTSRKGLYHEVAPDLEDPPTIVVCPHAGIAEPSYTRTWHETFLYIRNQTNLPCIITGYNIEEVLDDMKYLMNWGLKSIVEPTPNPFRGLRPYLDPMRAPDDMLYGHAAYAVVQGNVSCS